MARPPAATALLLAAAAVGALRATVPLFGDGRPPARIVVSDCRIMLIDQVTLAADRTGIVSSTLPREGDAVVSGQTIAALKDDVAAAALAVAEKQAENDVEVRYAKKAAEVAQAEHERAVQANRRLAGTVPDIEIKRLNLAAERAVLQIEQAEHDLEVHRRQRDQAKAELDTFHVEAPFDGIVTRVIRSKGEAVRQGDPILDLASTRRVRVEGEAELNQSWRLKPGVPVMVKLDLPDLPPDIAKQSFSGKLVFVDVAAQPVSGRIRVWAEVANDENVLRAGLPARMTIGEEGARNEERGTKNEAR